MITSKTMLLFFIAMVFISILFANLAHQIDFNINPGVNSKYNINFVNKFDNSNATIFVNTTDRLMWFMQVSDLHISKFHDQSRITELRDFCSNTINAIKPAVVLASGDLTDAKHKNNMGSGQYEDEWITYSDILKKCNVQEKTIWLDIRGNHDNFNVPGWKSHLNFFRNYSIQGGANPRSYMHVIDRNGEKFAFIAVDACLDPGPRRPFNFMGMLSKEALADVKTFVKRAEEINVDHTIWFGHYPSSCILTPAEEPLRKLISNVKTSKAYLCGHLHTMGGLVPEMYTLQKQGYLELELGDWKDNRLFRLAAMDHGMFSFIDVEHGNWPITLITNPKHALFVMPERESLSTMKEFSHIRLIAFSLSPIHTVEVKINQGKWMPCKHVNGPLYIRKWDGSFYHSGLHMMYARVRDTQGRESIVEQPFSMDGTKMSFKLLAKMILMLDAARIFQCMFGTLLMLGIIPLILLRYLHKKTMSGQMKMLRTRKNLFYSWLRKMWLLSTIDKLFYPLLLFEVYLTVGPWTVGEVLEGYIGVIFAWGLLVNGVYIPGAFTYAYGFIQMFVCQLPLTLILANCVDENFQHHWSGRKRVNRSLLKRFITHVPFVFILSAQMVLAYFFWLAYGTMAFLLGPMRTWSIFLNIYLWYQAITLPPECTREGAKIWASHNFQVKSSLKMTKAAGS